MTCNHETHSRKEVSVSIQGSKLNFQVYDWNKYKDIEGYCSGKDDISRTLLNGEGWEKETTPLVLSILKTGSAENLVLDFGANIGWYTVMAAKAGYNVLSFEGNKETCSLLNRNVRMNNCLGTVQSRFAWIDGDSEPLELSHRVELFKSDLEGNDHHAVKMCENLFSERRINYALIEVSPVFTPEHKDLPKRIEDYGYETIEVIGDPAEQANYLFRVQ